MDMGFSDRLTGPGPRATDQVRLQALGLHHRANREDRIALNSFVDFWALTINHDVLWIPLLQMTRIILKLRPVLLRPCSSKLCNLFVNGSFRDGFAPITADTQSVSANFFNGRSPPTWHELQSLVSEEGLSLKWSECHSYRWSDIVGEIFVVPVREIWALCLPDFDGGLLKYDPRMIEVIGDLKRVIALKGVVAEQVITNHVKDEGGPGSSLEEFSRLKQAIEAECRGKGLSDELAMLKVRYREMYRTVLSERFSARSQSISEAQREGGVSVLVSTAASLLHSELIIPVPSKGSRAISSDSRPHTGRVHQGGWQA